MTAVEINNMFDLLYDNASLQAPGLEMYEKSMFLTQAYKEIIKEFAPDIDKVEKRTRGLDRLIVNKYINFNSEFDSTFSGVKINSQSRIFQLPDDVWYILQERIYTSSTDSIKVTPKTIDEYNIQIANRFRRPSAHEAWRLSVKDDISETETHIIEIICVSTPVKYQFRYLKKPKPIILEDLSALGYTIDGESSVMIPEVTTELHETIVKRAVVIAIEAYKPQQLQTKIAVTDKEN